MYSSGAPDKIGDTSLFISDYSTAYNKEALKAAGVTHIVSVMNSPSERHPGEFQYCLVEADDDEQQDLLR